MSLRKSLAAVAAATLVGVLAAGVGIAGAEPLMTVDPTVAEVGSAVTVSGTECSWLPDVGVPAVPGDVSVVIAGELVGQTAAGVDGTWSVEVTAPAEPGGYQVVASCDLYQGAFDYPAQDLQVTATTPEPVPPTATLGEVTRQGCEVSIPVTTTGTGPFVLTVWDDGDVVDDMTWDPGTGPTTTVLNWVITAPAGEQSPGVGLYVTVTFDGEQLELADIDPFEYPASVAQACGEAGGMSVVLLDYADSVTSGGTVEVVASGFWPGEQVTVDLHSDPVQLATLTADANGTVSGSLVIPASTPPGDHTLVLTGVLSLLTTQIGVVVAAQGVPDPTQPGVTVTAAATETATETQTETATATATATQTATQTATAAATATASPAATVTATEDGAVGGGGTWTASSPFATVAATSNGPALASTGTDATRMSFVGLGLLLAGGAFLMVGRRRHTAGHRH